LSAGVSRSLDTEFPIEQSTELTTLGCRYLQDLFVMVNKAIIGIIAHKMAHSTAVTARTG
jgi:hypothetical protein